MVYRTPDDSHCGEDQSHLQLASSAAYAVQPPTRCSMALPSVTYATCTERATRSALGTGHENMAVALCDPIVGPRHDLAPKRQVLQLVPTAGVGARIPRPTSRWPVGRDGTPA